jgi:hypothetical protein
MLTLSRSKRGCIRKELIKEQKGEWDQIEEDKLMEYKEREKGNSNVGSKLRHNILQTWLRRRILTQHSWRN